MDHIEPIKCLIVRIKQDKGVGPVTWSATDFSPVDAVQIVSLLRSYSGLSRAELAALMHATPATITHQVRGLIDGGWVQEAGVRRSLGGRPRVGLCLNDQAAFAVAVEVGLTTVVIAAVDFGGHIVAARRIPESVAAITQGITVIAAAIREVVEEVDAPPEKWAGLGLAIPGIWDMSSQSVAFAPNLVQWTGINLVELLRRTVGLDPVVVENDADASALGELWFGAGRELQDLLFVLCDVGIGSGIIIQRRLVRGQDNTVGEIGHLVVEHARDLPACGCGHVGCLESVASLAALQRYVAHGMVEAEALKTIAGYLGMALAGVVNLLGPQTTILGGALFDRHPVLWPLLVQDTRSRVLTHLLHRTQFILSPLGDQAALLGLAGLIFGRRLSPETGPRLSAAPRRLTGNTKPLDF